MTPADRIFAAADTTDVNRARHLAVTLKGAVGGVKLGKEFFTANGPKGVQTVAERGQPIFLDLKYHDIPNTVAGAVKAALPLNPFMLSVHASGGGAMMRAAVQAAQTADSNRPLMLAVTVLTSLSAEDLDELGVHAAPEAQVVRLARLAQSAGMDGAVCSAREIRALRDACGPRFKLVVPGIRPKWAPAGDQKRVMTPKDAVNAGADYLVIGRPIIQAGDPAAAAARIGDELA